jgi:hypothetical protein
MIFLGVLLAAAHQSQATRPNGEFLPLLHDYQGCVMARAAEFAEAKEPVADTVAASFAACKNERASIILMMNGEEKPDGSERWPLERADKFVADLIDKPLADKITVGLFSERSGEK